MSYKEVLPRSKAVPSQHIPELLRMKRYWVQAKYFNALKNISKSQYYKKDTSISRASFVNTSYLCTFIAGHLLVFGQWYLLECNKTVKSPYIVCEKKYQLTGVFQKSRIFPSTVTCFHPQQYYMRGVCYQLLNTTWSVLTKNNCRKPTDKPFPAMTEENVFSKWAYQLTNEIGIWQNKSSVTCIRKLCLNCFYQTTYSWKNNKDCDRNISKRYWLCQTTPMHNRFSYPGEVFKCDDGTYILLHYKCDKKQHCGDNSDEKSCTWNKDPSNDRDREDMMFMMFIEIEDVIIPLYKWYNILKLNMLEFNTQYPVLHRDRYNVNDLGACPSGWSRCSPDKDSACYPNEHACVYERDIYGDPLYCANTANIKDCPTSSLPHICPSMFKCDQSYCIPYHMVSESLNVTLTSKV